MTAAAPPGTVVYAIGDIHGRLDLLAAMQQMVEVDAGRRGGQRRQLVYLGDYVSRGPSSRGVVDRVLKWARESFECITLKGNHEDLLLRYLGGELDAGRHWFDYDGLDTLADYGVIAEDSAARDDDTLEMLRRRFAEALPKDHLDFFRGLRISHRAGDYFFAHGGVRPGVPLELQTDRDCMWIRKAFLESTLDHGAIVVHGHSISPAPECRPNRVGIDTGAYRSGMLTCLVLDGTQRSFLQADCKAGCANTIDIK